ncbi:MAG: carboxypeptidase regulatory-like domain-containing protein [Minicystis sp.]
MAGRDNVLTLEVGGAIEGDVVDERGQAITSFQLGMESYQGSSNETLLGQTRSIENPRGTFRWENLSAGTYVLSASTEGRPVGRSRAIEVELSRTTHHVRIVIPRGATLSGRIIDAEDRKPLAGATVAFDALTNSGLGGAFATADENGNYSLAGAPPGPFSVRASREGYISKIVPGLVTRGADAIHQDIELRRFVEGGPRDELAGIGAVLAPTPAGVVIGPLVPGGPAERAGLRRGDRIMRIDGVDASAMPMTDCVQRLRGADGTIVSVQVAREGKTLDFDVVRRPVAR